MSGPTSKGGLRRHIGFWSATALVVSNIIGAGIFTTTGFQAADLGNPLLILGLWLAGGILALSGALCYAELGAAIPEAGAEYAYLKVAYGRSLGFMSGFVSLVAGFSAPIAAASKSIVSYLSHFFPYLESQPRLVPGLAVNDVLAVGIVWLLIAIHSLDPTSGFRFNTAVTLLKVGGIVLLIGAGVLFGQGDVSNLFHVSSHYEALSTTDQLASISTSLIFVMFCYSGWNASAYVASEFHRPTRDLPLSLLFGTGVVTVLYIALNSVYFYGASVEELAGKAEVGLVSGRNLFGFVGVSLVTVLLVSCLFASASAMTIAGPRVYYALGCDFRRFSSLARTTTAGAPRNALLLQGLVTTLIILSGTIRQIQLYTGFTLTLTGSLAILAVLVLRRRQPGLPRPFKVWLYPAPMVLFLLVSAWTLTWAFFGRPVESTLGVVTVVAGWMLYHLFSRASDDRRGSSGS